MTNADAFSPTGGKVSLISYAAGDGSERKIGYDTNPLSGARRSCSCDIGVTAHQLLTRPLANRREFASRTDSVRTPAEGSDSSNTLLSITK